MTRTIIFPRRQSRRLLAAALAACAIAAEAADVGVSISVGEPGFYGQLNIGNMMPQLVYPQPVIIAPRAVALPPLYLRVPPGHARHWEKHCFEYGACDRQVYFVQDEWYNNVYAPYYREHYGRHDHHDDDRRGPPGRARGHGHGHDRD